MALYKIILIQPPIQDFYETSIRLQPIGLCYLKAIIQQRLPEFEVVIKDYHHGWGRRTIPIPKELVYLKEYYPHPDKSPFSTFYHYYHFGASFAQIAEDIHREKPDLIGISSLFSPYYREVIQTARIIKKTLEVPIIAGGSHVSAMPEEMLSHAEIDYIIRGEGELPLVDFLKAWKLNRNFTQVPNLGYKQNGELVLNPVAPNESVNSLPIPDFSDFEPLNYTYEGRPLCFILTSRGCPHHCSFCSVHQTFGNRYRRRSPEAVFEEIRLRYRAGYRVFDFEDDNLTFNLGEIKHLCRLVIQEFGEETPQFQAMNGISFNSWDTELLELMKQAGFTHLNLSLVSSDNRTRQNTQRPHAMEDYLSIVQSGYQLGFKMVSYQIIGLPEESLASMINTLITNTQLPVLLGASMFYLTPNTPIATSFPEFSEEDIFKSRLTAMAIETPWVKRDDIYTLFITCRILNFLKGISFDQDALSIGEVLNLPFQNTTQYQMGMTLFKKLFQEGYLSAVVGRETRPVPRFQPELFFQIWSQLEFIVTQQGNQINQLGEIT